MAEILAQLGIDQTFYIQFAVFVAIFFILPSLFFKPFQKLIEARHQKTVADRERAEELVKQANAKLEEFRTRMSEERTTRTTCSIGPPGLISGSKRLARRRS